MGHPTKIYDEFTDLPISRARKKQLRNRKAGLCECGKPRHPASKSMCELCVLKFRRMNFGRKPRKTTGPTNRGGKRIL